MKTIIRRSIEKLIEDWRRSGQPERLFFLSRRAHLLTTRKAGGGIPPSSGTCALCEPSTGCFLKRGRPCRRSIKVWRHALCSWQSAGCRQERCMKGSSYCPLVPSRSLQRQSPGPLLLQAVSKKIGLFLLLHQKKQNCPPCGRRK